MVKQTFVLNDGSKPCKEVHRQKSKRYDALIIQISEVFWYFIGRVPQYRYIYEEINPVEDSVVYARYMGEEHIRKNYPWFFEEENEEGGVSA